MAPQASPLQRFTDFDAVASVSYDEAASKALHKDYWRVAQGFKYYFGDAADNLWAYVPTGYLSDGASIPRLFWSLLPPWGAYGQAAILHDFLCERLELDKDGSPYFIERAQADKALKEAMIALGVPVWKRNVIYIAVRVYAKLARIKGPDFSAAKMAYYKAHPQMEAQPGIAAS